MEWEKSKDLTPKLRDCYLRCSSQHCRQHMGLMVIFFEQIEIGGSSLKFFNFYLGKMIEEK